jgi:hypothetical protein
MRPSTGKREGFVLMAVIFSIAIMSLVVVVAFATSDDERRSARASRESTLALYAAEAGMRSTLGNWPTTAAAALTPGDSLALGWVNIPNGGRYQATIHRVDNGGLQHYSVVVQGRRSNTSGGQSMIVSGVSGVSRFKSAIAAQGNITMSGSSNGIIDGYDSDNAAYSATAGDTVTVLSNGSISLYNAFTVRGDVKAASTTWNTSSVTGEVKPFAQPFPANPILPCPTGGYSTGIPTSARVNYSSGSGVLYVESNGSLTLSGSNTYYFNQFLVDVGGVVTINTGGQRVDIFVRDWFGIAPGGVVNSSGKPTQLAFWACGTPPAPTNIWYLGGGPATGPGAQYSVYAPNHELSFDAAGGAHSHFFGAYVGGAVTIPSTSRIHYDVALTRIPSTQLKTLSGSWAQLPAN